MPFENITTPTSSAEVIKHEKTEMTALHKRIIKVKKKVKAVYSS